MPAKTHSPSSHFGIGIDIGSEGFETPESPEVPGLDVSVTSSASNDRDFWPAQEVRQIADMLIPEHHVHLMDKNVTIIYIFAAKAPKVGGQDCAATASKVTGRNAYLANLFKEMGDDIYDVPSDPDEQAEAKPFFVTTVWDVAWRIFTVDQRMALVDHELMHCQTEINKKGETVLKMRPHDVEEFGDIIARWGLWTEQLKKVMDAAKDYERRHHG